MATLGNALLGGILGHSDAEKMFRPWWDNIEDFVVYGLIMLGLIVSPTTIFNGTPLYCTLCQKEKQCYPYNSTAEDPGYHMWWVKSYCTMNALTYFTLYFPYILFLTALLLVGIERLFSRIFKTNVQIEGFYSLVQEASSSSETSDTSEDLEDTIKTVEVRQSFQHNSSFFTSYLLRTFVEFVVALGLTFYMIWFGVGEIQKDRTVYCEVHEVYYECHGIPHQFYLVVLFVALCMMFVYLGTAFITIMWLLCPCWGNLARLMNNYSSELHSAAVTDGKDNVDEKTLMGEVYEIYYGNRDLRLLLDLLAQSRGLAPPLRVMALMDKKFRNDCAPFIHSVERSEIIDGESDVVLQFSESHLASNVLSKITALNSIYTVQISPRTDKDSLEVIIFNQERTDQFFNNSFNYFRKPGSKASDESPRKTFVFQGVDADTTYTIRVSLVLNGKAMATTQKKIKAILPDRKEHDAEVQLQAALMVSQSQIQLTNHINNAHKKKSVSQFDNI